ncbi:MAG: adenosine deaminase [Roseiflexaceae bacterium]|nr:adenosine deaminase [Roseiflexaceae bacterium]
MATNTQRALTPELDDFIVRMPKVELHLHLEGSISPRALLEIAQRNDVDIPARDEAGVAQLFKYRNFSEFLAVFMALARALRYGRDFEQIAYELGEYLHGQHVRYAEIMLSPALYHRRGIDLSEVVQGTAAGLARAEHDFGVRTRLAFDFGRQFGVDLAWQILDVAIQHMRYGLVAWSIGGDEVNFPPEPYAEVFAAARRAGLRTMAHAGEVGGAQSVWGAVDVLGAERLGHGIRSIDDPKLITHLRERRIVLDICPTSNVRTGAVSAIEMHPLRQLYDAGVLLSINSDDPIFFATTMIDEYRLAAQAFGFGIDELTNVMLDSVHSTFLPIDEKRVLVDQFEREIAALRAELGF